MLKVDTQILLNSSLYAQFMWLVWGDHTGLLLGDSGYAFLFTPHLHPITPEQKCYNQAHMHTRSLVEHMFGVWKSLCRNTLRFTPRSCCIVINATAVLHNYLKQHECPDHPILEDNPDVPSIPTNRREDLLTEKLLHCVIFFIFTFSQVMIKLF